MVSTFKGPLVGLLLVVAYASMVINIISIRKVEVGESTYPPAVVAMLVLSICQMFWLLSYFIMSGKGALWKASTAAATMLFWACFNFGAIVAVTVLRYHNRYCGASNTIRSDCAGVLRGVMALGWSLFGLDLIFLGYLASLVSSSRSSWSQPLHNIPPLVRVVDPEAPKH
ncbi:hypothetical protein JCM24511_00399 [Saitozyma sp. JCM 24511]|nr:hypothetical protein JCM24511_00399 [Saitozyma sp. JCM 24511]